MTNISDLRPEVSYDKIVGIYLTELDFIMVKVKLSDGTYINHNISKLQDILPAELLGIGRDISDWRFIPCCE
jgi:hypothetical protein